MVIGVSIYPVGYAVWTSLHKVNPAMGMNAWVGLDNYRNVFVQQEFRTAARVTFRFAASVTILTVLLGLGMALVLNQRFLRSRPDAQRDAGALGDVRYRRRRALGVDLRWWVRHAQWRPLSSLA